MAAAVKFDTPIGSSDQSFDRVLSAGLPVAAVFWRGTSLEPALQAEMTALARAESGKLLVAKVRLEDNPGLAQRYSLRAPAVLITFRNGKELKRIEKPTPAQFREHVDYLLGRGPEPQPPVQTPPPQQAAGPTAGKPVAVSDATFGREVMQSSLPVVVDFWAAWCGPCKMVAPALEKIAAEYAGRLRVAKVNVDENPYTAQQYQVQGIPTLLFVRKGRVVNRVVGALPEPRIRAQVEELVNS